jgi:Spy/CpxP family protein refolding chaperone
MNFKIARRALALGFLAALALPGIRLSAEMNMKDHGGMDKKMMDRMMKKLDLSDSQAKQMKALHKEQRTENEELCGKMDANLASLKVLIEKKASDAELTALVSTLQDEYKAMHMAQHENCEAMLKILTPLQQAKMLVNMHEAMNEGYAKDWRHGREDKVSDKDEDK